MCNAMGQEDEYTACDKCDLRDFGCPAIYEKECDSADWNHVERVVAKWAAEHPEPQYPTWAEYIAMLMLDDIPRRNDSTPQTLGLWMNNTPIPADIAQKLGIEPKEV